MAAFDGWLAFALGVVCTALLVAAGVAVGMFWGRRTGRKKRSGAVDLRGVAAMMDGLADWTSGVMENVTQYNQLVDDATEWLQCSRTEDSEKLAKAVSLLSQIARTNDLLKQRLADAERRLHEQTDELQTFMSEARTDVLTSLPNRRAFQDELARRESEWRRHQVPFSALMVDVDHFKQINDQHGHAAGDEVLKQIALILKAAVRNSDLVARVGGEEFAVLLAFAEIDTALQTAERIRQTVAEAVVQLDAEGTALRVSLSGGVAQIQVDEAGKQLLARADEALYAAKAAGRNAIWWHDGTLTHSYGEGGMVAGVPRSGESTSSPEYDFYAACADLRRQLTELSREVDQERARPQAESTGS